VEAELGALIEAVRQSQDLGQLRAWRARVEAEPPSRTRERALAWLFLAEAEGLLASGRVREAYGPMLTAYSYARTAGDAEAFLRAREGVTRLREFRDAGSPKRRKRRR